MFVYLCFPKLQCVELSAFTVVLFNHSNMTRHDINWHGNERCHKIRNAWVDSVSFPHWHRHLPVHCPSSSSIQEETYESFCQSISSLYCLSCWVSMSHVRGISCEDISGWGQRWHRASIKSVASESVRTSLAVITGSERGWEGDGRFIGDAIGRVCGGEALPRRASTPGLTTKPTAACATLLPSQKWK